MRGTNVSALSVIFVGLLLVTGCPAGNADDDDRNDHTHDVASPDVGVDADAVLDTAQMDAEPPLVDMPPPSTCVDDGCDDPDLSHCDETSGECVACLDATHCEDPGAPICRSGACEGCQTDTQCANAGASAVCRSDGRCVMCERDDECPAEYPVCDADGECQECAESLDCPSVAPVCIEGACESCADIDTCTNDDRVREVVGLLCERAIELEGEYHGTSFQRTYESIQAVTCAGDETLWPFLRAVTAAMSSGRVVVDEAVFQECRTQGFGAPVCDGLFMPGVVDGDPCYVDVECFSGTCETDATCPGLCASRSGLNGACSLSGDCRRGLTCIDNTCQQYPGLNETCTSFCEAGLYCDSGTCATPQDVGATCTSSIECRDALYCDTSAGECAEYPGPGEPCLGGLACEPGVRCWKGTCQDPQPLGAACLATPQCEAGLRCIDETSCEQILLPGEQCEESAHCALGLGCIDGRCRTLPDVGEPCFEEGGCLRGECNTMTGNCEALPIDAPCTDPPYPFDVFDPCGDQATCAGDGTGNAKCTVESGVGAICGGASDPPCRAPETTCGNGGVCEEVCEAEAM